MSEAFSVTPREAPLDLAAQVSNYRTRFMDLFVENSTKLNISAITIPDPQLKSSEPFVGIWKGTDKIRSIDELIATAGLILKSDGTVDKNPVAVSLTKSGVNLLNDDFTVGLFLYKGDFKSLGASVNGITGAAENYQPSFVSVADANNRYLSVDYKVPDTVEPADNLHDLYLFKGDSLPADRGSYLKKMRLSSNDYTGRVKVQVDDILLKSGPYLVAINPGISTRPFSCTSSFKIN